jgi:hypothetical protein
MPSRRVHVFRYFVAALGVSALLAPACSSDSDDGSPGDGGSAGAGMGGDGVGGDGNDGGAGTGNSGTGGNSGRGGASATGGRGGTSGSGASGQAGAGGDEGGAGGDGGSGGTTEVTLTTYAGTMEANAPLVALRDDDADWQEISGSAGVYRFTPTTGRYSVAVVCVRSKAPMPGRVVTLWSVSALAREITSLARACSVTPPTPTQFALTLSVTGLTAGQTATAVISGAFLSFSESVTSHTSNVDVGTYDVLLRRQTSGTADSFVYSSDNGVSMARTLTYAFATDGAAPTTGTITATNAPATDMELGLDVHSEQGKVLNAHSIARVSTTPFFGPPASELSGDAVQAVFAKTSAPGERRLQRFARQFSGAVDLRIPDAFGAPTVSVVSTARLSADGSRRSGTQVYTLTGNQTAADDTTSSSDSVTAGYLGSSDVTLANPDLRELAAWDPSYAFASGTSVSWTMTAQRTNRTVAETFAGIRVESSQRLRGGLSGSEWETVSTTGTIVP